MTVVTTAEYVVMAWIFAGGHDVERSWKSTNAALAGKDRGFAPVGSMSQLGKRRSPRLSPYRAPRPSPRKSGPPGWMPRGLAAKVIPPGQRDSRQRAAGPGEEPAARCARSRGRYEVAR